MKRLFNIWKKEYKKSFDKMQKKGQLGLITVMFNRWVSNSKVDGLIRFQFKAHTNKFQISKWV